MTAKKKDKGGDKSPIVAFLVEQVNRHDHTAGMNQCTGGTAEKPEQDGETGARVAHLNALIYFGPASFASHLKQLMGREEQRRPPPPVF